MNDDAAASYRRRQASRVVCSHLVVVDYYSCGSVPDLDPEPVDAPTAVQLTINGSQQEPIIAGSVYSA